MTKKNLKMEKHESESSQADTGAKKRLMKYYMSRGSSSSKCLQ